MSGVQLIFGKEREIAGAHALHGIDSASIRT